MSSNPSQLGKVEAKGENEAREQGIRKEHGDEKENVNAQSTSLLALIDSVHVFDGPDAAQTRDLRSSKLTMFNQRRAPIKAKPPQGLRNPRDQFHHILVVVSIPRRQP